MYQNNAELIQFYVNIFCSGKENHAVEMKDETKGVMIQIKEHANACKTYIE